MTFMCKESNQYTFDSNIIFVWIFFVYYTFKLSMYIAYTVPRCYTLKPLSLVLYLEEEEEKKNSKSTLSIEFQYLRVTSERLFRKLGEK